MHCILHIHRDFLCLLRSVLSEWREFPLAPCLVGGGGLDSSRLDVVEIARVA
jgi:hypothetical protein